MTRKYRAQKILVAAAVLTCSAGMVAAEKVDRSDWIADYAFLKSELQRNYSHLAWFGSPEGGVDLPTVDRRALEALRRARTKEQAQAAIREFVDAFPDGHFEESVAPTGVPVAAEPPMPASYSDARAACAAYGYAPRTSVTFSAQFESLVGFALLTDGIQEPFRSGLIEVEGRRLGLVRIPRFRAKEFPHLCVETWNSLRKRGEKAGIGEIGSAIDRAWLATLAARLERLKREGADTVLVDIGGNGGGNDLGDWTVRLLSSAPVRSAPLYVVHGASGIAYLDEQLDGLHAALNGNPGLAETTALALRDGIAAFEASKERARQTPCDMSWVWREQRPWGSSVCTGLVDVGFASGHLAYSKPGMFDARAVGALYWPSVADEFRGAWDGPVYILVDGGTGSAAEMFSALSQDRIAARTVGTRSYGDGCGFMSESEPIVLPHTRLAFVVPSCVRLRADGSDEVAGITPDIEVAPRDGESARARAARIVAAIAGEHSQT